ncbi:hypothetical protein ACSBR2_010459 [Camellia fascicularis]
MPIVFAIWDNTELRKLSSGIPSKSIIVIEDIDCSLDISCQRGKKKSNRVQDSDPIVGKLKQSGDGESEE